LSHFQEIKFKIAPYKSATKTNTRTNCSCLRFINTRHNLALKIFA
jgi:hypothetical protein